MFLNIITPCSRPENLKKIVESISIPREEYRWLVILDSESIPDDIPDNCEAYPVKVVGSIVGNGQRNYALDLVDKGYIYFNDDDAIIHPELWNSINQLEKYDFISFGQNNPDGSLRLKGDNISLNNIDSHNFITHISCIGNTRWKIDQYGADGIFAEECYKKAKNKIYLPLVLSIYNSLRNE